MLEIETKLYLESEQRAREVCRQLALPWLDGTFERNRIFDFADGRLQGRGALVRVRERNREGFLTYKERTDRDVAEAKVRLEYDTEVSDPASVVQLLVGLGLREVLSYERYRARHTLATAHLEVDRMPGGWFCEIEGSPEEIRRVRKAGGLEQAAAVVWSYPEILTALQEAGMAKGNWTFAAHDRGELRLPGPDHPFWSRAKGPR